jgi:hypothetical protein
MIKSCGGCKYFLKVNNYNGSSGICELHDSRCDTDYKCSDWKGIKYKRSKHKIKLEEIK